jgi:DNA-binding NtrC family response regulator
MTRQRVLVVEDDEIMRVGIREVLRLAGYDAIEAETCSAAKEIFQTRHPDAAIVDYLLPDGTAFDLLPFFRELDPTAPLVVLTGHGTIDLAVRAVQQGADQFLTKPVEFPTVVAVLERAIETQRNRRKIASRAPRRGQRSLDPFIGKSAAIRTLASQAERIAASNSIVLITGETGTGKSILARWFHSNGPRFNEPFVELNCAGLTPELLESELFGHEKGAFTGATTQKLGLLEVAHKGTVFLDEIGDMELQVQAKLLKVLEERRFRRVGDLRDRFVDVRLIAATHQNLEEAVREKRFRSDLYYRISTIPLTVPSLRQRADDVIEIAESILVSLAERLGVGHARLGDDAKAAISSYSWPGNIRELRNVLERALLLRDSPVLGASDLRFTTETDAKAASGDEAEQQEVCTLLENERRHIRRVLQLYGGNVNKTARVLDVSRSALYERLKKLEISID